MVQIIENRAMIDGVIQDIHAHPKLNGYHQLVIKLEKSESVNDLPNLAKIDESKKIIVSVSPEQFNEAAFKKEKRFKGVVRKVSPTEYFYSKG